LHSKPGAGAAVVVVVAAVVVFAASSAQARPCVVGSSQPFWERTWQRHAPTERRSDSKGSRTSLGRRFEIVQVIRRQYVDVVK